MPAEVQGPVRDLLYRMLEKDPEQRITVSTDRAGSMTQELMAYPLFPLFSDGRDTYPSLLCVSTSA
jgi:serine/threonine protein kinase